MKKLAPYVALATVVIAMGSPATADPNLRPLNPILDPLKECLGSLTGVETAEKVHIDFETNVDTGIALAWQHGRRDAAYFEYVGFQGPGDNPTVHFYRVTGYTTQVDCQIAPGCTQPPTGDDLLAWLDATLRIIESGQLDQVPPPLPCPA
jgi:hypothetical protein